VAWIDYGGQLHVGNPLTRVQHVIVANTGASPTTPLVEAHDHVYWVDFKTTLSPASGDSGPTVRDVNLRTGATRNDGFGRTVFLSANKHQLFITRTTTDLSEVSLLSQGSVRRLAIPSGWIISSGNGFTSPLSVSNGIVVQRPVADDSSFTLGIWNPPTGRIHIVGQDQATIDAFTPAGGSYSLLAWVPANCVFDRPCFIRITDTKNLATVRVADPLPYGFDVGGAFSSDGTNLAVFVKTNSGDVNPTTQMAIVNTRDGKLRLITGAIANIGESVGWAQWLPGSRTLLGGAVAGVNFTSSAFVDNHYVVNATSLSATPFTLVADRNLDINFSAVAFASPR